MAEFKVGDKVRYRGMIAEVVDPRLYGKKVQDGYVYIEYYDKNEKSYCGEGVKKTDLVAANSRALNDKWIDDFHVIVTSGKPDASLLSALKDKATAWKLSKKNFSDRTAADRHNAAESKVYDIARRLGAKVIQQGAVMKVVMPNSRVCNSTNPVVIKAMNSVATNAKSMDRWIFDIMLHQRMGDHGKGAEDYMRQNREQIENDVGKDGFRKLCSKFGNTLAYNARNHIVRKAMNAVWRNANPKITGKGRISMDDDIVAVYKPNGKMEWRGMFDDCAYRHDDMIYDPSTKTYRVNGPGGDYRIIALNNAVARNSTKDLQILLQTADTDIDDGDIDEAKQILRETRTRAIRSGYTREWMEVAKRVGMK